MSANHFSALPTPIENQTNLDPDHRLAFGRRVLQQESAAIAELAERLDDSFLHAADLILTCRGSLLVSGMGKAGLIGQKIAATFASTGTPSHFLHPAEAIHGDLGKVSQHDLMLVLSYSGETEEITRVLTAFRQQAAGVIAMTGRVESKLARQSDIVLNLGEMQEACSLGLAPSTSTAAMLALGDALALLVSHLRGFGANDFARFHPGGALGKKLMRVDQVMRPLGECRVGSSTATVREVLVGVGRPGRRTGAIMLVDGKNCLSGIFTDSDLARMLEKNSDHSIDQPIASVMTRQFKTILSGAFLSEALEILSRKKISELPVVNEVGNPVGLIDITDVVSLMSASAEPEFHSDLDGVTDQPASAVLNDFEFGHFDDVPNSPKRSSKKAFEKASEKSSDKSYLPGKPRTPKRTADNANSQLEARGQVLDDEDLPCVLRIVRADDDSN